MEPQRRSRNSSAHTEERHARLIATNIQWLQQALDLLSRMDSSIYASTPANFAPHRVGGHLRHILEFYECFLSGVRCGSIDYDARRRDELVETSRMVADARIRSIVDCLERGRDLLEDRPLLVRIEDSASSEMQDTWLESSTGRELQVLSSHTIHHFALISMTLKAHGFPVSESFGMAPSTLSHLQGRREAA